MPTAIDSVKNEQGRVVSHDNEVEYDFEGPWTTIPRVRAATAQGVAGHCADEDKEDEQQRAVQGQHMVQDVCRQQWKLCGSDSG